MNKGLIIGIICLGALTGCVKTPKLVISGSGWNQIAVVDKKSKQIEWQHNLDKGTECNCVIVTKKGDIAYSYSGGARLINAANQEIRWDYKITQRGEIHSVSELDNGGFLLAASGEPAFLIELDKNGKEIKKIPFDGAGKNLHGQMRQIRVSKKGNYLIPLLSRSAVIELDKTGKEIASYPVPAAPFAVVELPSENLIVSCGDGHFFVEIDRNTGKTIRKVDQSMFAENNMMHYVAQINYLDNGNLLLCNWNGHFKKGEEKKVSHLVEFDKNYNVIWKLDNFTDIPRMSAFFYLKNGKHLKFKK